MNKLFTLFIAFIFITSINDSFGQSLELLLPTAVPDTVYGNPEDSELTSSAEIKNISSSDLTYKIACAPILLTPGHLYAVCDCENCYMPQEGFFQTPGNCVLQPNETSTGDIHVYLYPNNTSGTSIINVNFFNTSNQTDNVSYQAVFIVGASDIDEPVELTLLPADVIPNPGTDAIVIKNIPINSISNYDLYVFDSNGKQVDTQQIKGELNECKINTSIYLSGIYYYHLTESGKPVKTGSFVISK